MLFAHREDFLTPVDSVVVATLFLLTGLGTMQRPISLIHRDYGPEVAQLADSSLEVFTVFVYSMVNVVALLPNYSVRLHPLRSLLY